MITIFWSPFGFPVIDALPAGENFTGQYLCDNIVPQIAEQRPSDAQQNRGRKFVVHMDNATPHKPKSTESVSRFFGSMKRSIHHIHWILPFHTFASLAN
jgi:hypothetical protein